MPITPKETPITPQSLKQLRIIVVFSVILTITLSIGMVIAGFAAVSPDHLNGLPALRIIHVVITILVIIFSNMIAKKILEGKLRLQRRFPNVDASLSFFQRYTMSTVARVALIEGAAIFGAVLFYYAASTGAVGADPTYYLHFLPLLIFIAQAGKLYPTEEKVNALKQIHSALPS
jgi:hypothetical protein